MLFQRRNEVWRAGLEQEGWTRGAVTTALLVGLVVLHPSHPAVEISSIQTIVGQVKSAGGIAAVICAPGREDFAIELARALPNGFYVHALTTADSCASLRTRVLRAGLADRMTVSAAEPGAPLPYASNLLNVVAVVGGPSVKTSMAEVLRVLAPSGHGFIRAEHDREGARGVHALRPTWVRFRKPWPPDLGEWSHHLHGPDNNPVTHDLRVGPPRRLHWTVGPRWSRNHESAGSLPAMVSAAGTVFAVVDEGPIGITASTVPDKWRLVARDAFNGRVLWKHPLGDWGWRSWRNNGFTRSVPPSMARGLVATAEEVFVTDGFRGELLILDARTGELVRRCPDSRGTGEIVVAGDTVYAVQQTAEGAQRVCARSAVDGRLLWSHSSRCQPQTLCVRGSRVFWWDGDVVVAHDCASGRRLWTSGKLRRSLGRQYTLIAAPGTVLAANQGYVGELRVLDAASGRLLWRTRCRGGYVFSPPNIFVIEGAVWMDGYFKEWWSPRDRKLVDEGKEKPEQIPAICRWPTFFTVAGRELRTGRLLREIDTGGMFKTGHHHRCYRCRATSRFILAGRRGTEFIDLKDADFSVDNWVRGSCQLGFLPANGLLYAPPHPCLCYLSAKLTGFNALAPRERGARKVEGNESAAFRRGSAFSDPVQSLSGTPRNEDWPMFRGDEARSGSTPTMVPAELGKAWIVELGGRLTQPVVSGNRVLVAQVHRGVLHALDRASGDRRWRFKAGGYIDSAPTVFAGRVFFGCGDGWLYCLRLADGALIWQRRLAPGERFIGDHDQLASAWPVHGAVLVTDGVVYAAAGRASVLDGGIRLYGLEAITGAVRFQTTLSHNFSDPRKWKENNTGLMQAYLTDVLLREGDSIFMRHARFDLELHPVKRDSTALLAARLKWWGRSWEVVGTPGEVPHLVAAGGLLDHTLFNRLVWVRGDTSGQRLVWNDRVTCALNMFHRPRGNLLSPTFVPGHNEVTLVGRKTSAGATCPRDVPFDPPPQDCLWRRCVPVRVEAMVLAGNLLFVAGPPDRVDSEDPLGAFEGRKGGMLVAMDSRTGVVLHELSLDSPPVFAGLSAAHGCLWISTRNGCLVCVCDVSSVPRA